MATTKQKKAIKKIVENHGNVSKSMKEAGYSEKSAKNPKNLTESKGFQELMEKEGITDEFLFQKHKELLDKKETFLKWNSETHEYEVIPTGVIDSQAVKAGLDMAYKIKGKYAPDKIEGNINVAEVRLNDRQVEQLIRARTDRSNL
ncbi:MAG: hypothetical protein Q8910_01575 [Bacteroidota bacterium]|nr:hypothetical protein [Bacteroidota bacterium]